jgi:hypothetical protein
MSNVGNWVSQQDQQIDHGKEQIKFHYLHLQKILYDMNNNIYAFAAPKVVFASFYISKKMLSTYRNATHIKFKRPPAWRGRLVNVPGRV